MVQHQKLVRMGSGNVNVADSNIVAINDTDSFLQNSTCNFHMAQSLHS